MASTYSTNLAIELIGTGDQAGAWGNTTNTNLGTLIEQAISGYVTQAVSTGTDTTITIPNGATGVARNMYIELTGTGGTNTNLIVPANKKLYFIFNNTSSGQVTVKVSGQTGVSVPNKAKMILVSNGTDIVDATNYVGNLSAASANITVLTSASATISNLLATSLTVSGNTFLATSSGNVGIGTSSPLTKLDVRGVIASSFSGFVYSTIDGVTDGNLYITANAGAGNTTASNVIFRGSTSGVAVAERMRLDSSGNLGLGVTPSAWASGWKAMQVGSLSSLSDSGAVTYVGNNFYQNASSNNIYLTSSHASLYGQTAGQHLWYTAPSGTAGNAITFTQAMTLTAAGDLCVGTTSSLSAAANRQDITVNGANSSIFTLGVAGTRRGYLFTDGSDLTLSNEQNNALIFRTNATERARITSGGDFDVGTTANDGWKIHASATADQIRWSYDRNTYSAIFGFATHRGDSGGVEIGNINASSDRSICFSNGTSYAGRTERARITSGGDLCVQATSAVFNSTNRGNITIGGSASSLLFLGTGVTTGTYIYHDQSNSNVEFWNNANGAIVFGTNNTARARITNGGNLCVNTTDDTPVSITAHKLVVERSSTEFGVAVGYIADSVSRTQMSFYNSNGAVGTISTDGSATAYNTSSDRRLKENIVPADDAGSVVDSIQIVKHDWKVGGHVRYGVIAQDLHAVAPEAVKVGDDNEEVSDPWGVDYSKLVPMLIKEVQSLRKRVAELEAK